MANTYTWRVADLERNTSGDIVTTVHWTVTADNGTDSVSAYGSIGLAAPEEGAEIVPFGELTEEVCVGWACDAIGEDECLSILTNLDSQLDAISAPQTSSGTPW